RGPSGPERQAATLSRSEDSARSAPARPSGLKLSGARYFACSASQRKARGSWPSSSSSVMRKKLPADFAIRVPLRKRSWAWSQQGRGGVAAQPAIGGEAGDVVVDVATGLVGVAALDQPDDELDHLRHVLGGAREGVRRADVEPLLVGEEGLGVEGRDLGRRLL